MSHLLKEQIIEHLIRYQQQDGSYSSVSSPNGDFEPASTKETSAIFPSALILGILASAQNIDPVPDLNSVLEELSTFLISQKSDYWTFNYWKRQGSENATLPYPDDLDDTSCTIAGLAINSATIFSADDLARIVTGLTTAEQQEGGPYRSWFVNETAEADWHDIDVMVNSNIAYMLNLWDITIPNLLTFIENNIQSNTLTSRYYVDNPIYGIYSIARWYRGEHTAKLIQQLDDTLTRKDTVNDMGLAMAASAYYFLDAPEKATRLIEKIEQWSVERAWQAQPYVVEFKAIAGSPALTASLILEALTQAQQYAEQENTTTTKALTRTAETELADYIYEITTEQLSQALPSQRDHISRLLSSLREKDHFDEIALIPRYMATVLNNGDTVSDTLLNELGALNLSGWAAYTIYDDIIDEQSNTHLLPLANAAMRNCLSRGLVIDGIIPGFHQLVHTTLNKADAAMQWELNQCTIADTSTEAVATMSLPNFFEHDTLVERSFGHALGPLAVIQQLGFGPGSKEYGYVTEFFYHYLLARQLLDDMHDWEDDLSHDRINSAGAKVLEEWKIPEASQHQWYPHSETKEKQWQHVFWFRIAPKMCNEIEASVTAAVEALSKLTDQANTPLHSIVDRLQSAIATTQQEREDSIAFLESYHTQP